MCIWDAPDGIRNILMFYEVHVKAQCENMESLSISKNQPVWFKLKCNRCNLETCEDVEIDPLADLTIIEGSPCGAQLVIRCKDCRTQGNISIEEQKTPFALRFSDNKNVFQPIIRLDCRNVEPISFHVKPDSFSATALDSGVVFSSVDLTEGEWYDYDEKESREVNITDFEYRIMQTK